MAPRDPQSRSAPPCTTASTPPPTAAPGSPTLERHPTFRRFTRRRREPDLALVAQVPAFARADRQHLARLALNTDRVRLPPGRTVTTAGSTARELIVVVAGEAAVLHDDGDSVAARLHAGTEIGGRETLTRERHTATVVATSTLDLIVVNGPALRWAHAEGIADLSPSPTTGAEAPVEI